MTNPNLSNAVANEQVILWQYDKAPNLISLVKMVNDLATATTKDFWDYFEKCVFDIENADSFGLNLWGRILGIPRPEVSYRGAEVLSDGTLSPYDPSGEMATVSITDDFFRRILKGRFFMLLMPPTVPNYNRYLDTVFASDGSSSEGDSGDSHSTRCKVVDNGDMSMAFSFPTDATAEEAFTILQHPEVIYCYPAGIRSGSAFYLFDRDIGFSGQGMRNFAETFAWAAERKPTGGVLAATPFGGRLEKGDVVRDEADDSGSSGDAPIAQATAYVFDASIGSTIDFSPSPGTEIDTTLVCIDWGDGSSDFRNGTLDHEYAAAFRTVVVVWNASGVSLSPTADGGAQLVETYLLN